MEKLLLESFGKQNQDKVRTTLLKLLPHLNTENVILCGGIAIRHHLKKKNIAFDYEREFNDLDLMVKNVSDVRPSSAQDFMIYHYHDYSDKKPEHLDDFFVALLDREPKIKVDIFSYNPYVPFDPIEVVFENYNLKMRNPADQLATQVLESSVVLEDGKIDSKWIENIEGLMKVADLEKADEYFHGKHFFNGKPENPFTENIPEVFEKIKKKVAEKPELLVEKATHREPYKCELCENRNGFTVAPMEEAFKILGYVE